MTYTYRYTGESLQTEADEWVNSECVVGFTNDVDAIQAAYNAYYLADSIDTSTFTHESGIEAIEGIKQTSLYVLYKAITAIADGYR